MFKNLGGGGGGEECGVLGLVESSRDRKAVFIELVEFLPCVCCNSEFAHCLCIKYTTVTSAEKHETCIAKLNKGIELIEQRQKLIFIADKSEYGWKTVGEYLDNELANNDEDAKKLKRAEKEAQRKITETKTRSWLKSHRPQGSTATSTFQDLYKILTKIIFSLKKGQ